MAALRSVQHPTHGEGELLGWRRGGRRALVRFDGQALPVEVSAREITVADAPEGGTASALEGPALAGTYEEDTASLTLEAMRLGVVPAAALDAYTVGRDVEQALVAEDLARVERDGGAARAFLADYGVGKTHLLESIRQQALADGWVVAGAVLDASECPPSHPKRVWRRLARSLRYPDRASAQGLGLAPLLEQTAGQVLQPPHLYLSPALQLVQAMTEATVDLVRGIASEAELDAYLDTVRAQLLDWLGGHPTLSNQVLDREMGRLRVRGRDRLYSLKDYRPWARIYGYLLSGVAALCRRAGYRGLVITIDEAEFFNLLRKQDREHALALFRALAFAAEGESGGLSFEPEALSHGGYGVLKDLPPRYGDAPGLYVVMAMTPAADGLAALTQTLQPERLHTLTPLTREHYLQLTERVCDYYASAQPDWTLPQAVVGPLGKVVNGLVGGGFVANPRQAMKFLVGFLDVVRAQPEQVGPMVRSLQHQLMASPLG